MYIYILYPGAMVTRPVQGPSTFLKRGMTIGAVLEDQMHDFQKERPQIPFELLETLPFANGALVLWLTRAKNMYSLQKLVRLCGPQHIQNYTKDTIWKMSKFRFDVLVFFIANSGYVKLVQSHRAYFFTQANQIPGSKAVWRGLGSPQLMYFWKMDC